MSISGSGIHLANFVASTIYQSKGLEFNDVIILFNQMVSAFNKLNIGIFIQFFP